MRTTLLLKLYLIRKNKKYSPSKKHNPLCTFLGVVQPEYLVFRHFLRRKTYLSTKLLLTSTFLIPSKAK